MYDKTHGLLINAFNIKLQVKVSFSPWLTNPPLIAIWPLIRTHWPIILRFGISERKSFLEGGS